MTATGAALRPVTKVERQRAILQLVRTRVISTQNELVEALHELHLDATQATVSRDIREMGLVRVREGEGLRYVAAATEIDPEATVIRLRDAVRDHVHDLELVDNLAVIHTRPSTAPLVAAALDAARFEEVVGTVAGDDTVIAVLRSRPAGQRLHRRLASILEERR